MSRVFSWIVRTFTVPFLYGQVSRGRYRIVLAMCTKDVVNTTGGNGTLGGRRTSRAGYRAWWERMFRLCRSLNPVADHIVVQGGLRRSHVVIHWTDHITAWDGKVFENKGIHTLDLRWGRIARVSQEWDEQIVDEQARYAASLGYPEALEPPLSDGPDATPVQPRSRLRAGARWSALAARHRRMTLALTGLFLILAVATSGQVSKDLDLGGYSDPSSSSARAQSLLESHFPLAQPNVELVVTTPDGVTSADAVRAGAALTRNVAAYPHVVAAASFWTLGQPAGLRSKDGRQAQVFARLGGDDKQVQERIVDLVKTYQGTHDGLSVRVIGAAAVAQDVTDRTQKDLAKAEAIIAPVTLLLLVLVFGSLVAASLPLLLAVVSVIGTLVVLRILLAFTDVSFLAMNVTTGLGLGLAIDYSLLILSRYREELAAGFSVDEAITRTAATAGRTVLFSALTVTLALAGLLVFPLYFLRSFAYAGMAVTVFAAFAAVTVLPALLKVVGGRIDRFRILKLRPRPAVAEGRWYRFALRIMKRPVIVSVAVGVLLIGLALPFLHIQLGLRVPDPASLPPSSQLFRDSAAADRAFPDHQQDAVLIVLPNRPDQAALDGYSQRLSQLPEVARVETDRGTFIRGAQASGPSPESASLRSAAGPAYAAVVPTVAPYSNAGRDLVARVRSVPAPTRVYIGGSSATLDDTLRSLRSALPAALIIIVASSLLLLTLLTRSVLIPVKAVVLNLFSLSATFGAMVWIFQYGHFSHALGFTPTSSITATVPVLAFCIAFGLSMDYEVFLMSRIREEFDASGDNEHAIASGLEATGRVFTAAAGLVAVVFLSFLVSGIQFVKLIGLALALAVLLDASLVRGMLVPALLKLAGRANWWLPSVLSRLPNPESGLETVSPRESPFHIGAGVGDDAAAESGSRR